MPEPDHAGGARRGPWPALLSLVALAFALHGWVLGTAILGHDSYPILAASRIDSWSDFVDGFREAYMDGRFRTLYYRPILSLSFAVDQWLWGLDSFGIQLSSLLALAAATCALYLLARSLLGARADCVPWLAALVFLLHPAHVASLPIPSRRHDALCFVFAAWCLIEHLRPAALAGRGVRIRTGVLALLAMGTKETALVLPAVAAIAVALYSAREGWLARCLHGARATVPDFLALAVALAARFTVIEALGGPEVGDASNLGSSLSIAHAVLLPLPAMERSALATPALIAATFLSCLALGRFVLPEWRRALGVSTAPWRAAAFAVCWVVVVTLPLAFLGEIRSWRLLFSLTGLALLAALSASGSWRRLRFGSRMDRVFAGLGLAPLVFFAGWHAAYAPPLRHYEQWDEADRLARTYFEDLARRIDGAADGDKLYCEPIPVRAIVPREELLIPPPPVLLSRSVQAWAELSYPGRKFKLSPKSKADVPFQEGVLIIYRLRDGEAGVDETE